MPKYQGVTKRGNKFYFWIYHKGKHIWSKGFETAEEAARERERELHKIKKAGFTPSNITFKDFIIKYLQDYLKLECKKSTIIQVESLARLYIVPYLGNKKLTELKKRDFIHLNAEILKNKTPARAYQILRTCKKILNKAVEWEYISYNPIPPKLIKKPQPERHPVISFQKINEMIDNLQGMDKYIIAVAGYTGMRRGEIFGLQWKDIDFDKKIIRLERQYTSGEVTTLKTSGSYGVVPMLLRLPELLKEWRSEGRSLLWVFPGTRIDKPYAHERWIGRNWQAIKKRFNLPDNFRFHDFRHSFATNLIEAGIPVAFVQLLLRHESYKTTTDKYGHYAITNIMDELNKSLQKLFVEKLVEKRE